MILKLTPIVRHSNIYFHFRIIPLFVRFIIIRYFNWLTATIAMQSNIFIYISSNLNEIKVSNFVVPAYLPIKTDRHKVEYNSVESGVKTQINQSINQFDPLLSYKNAHAS